MDDSNQEGGLDDFTRRYAYFLGGVAIIGLIWWLTSLDFRAGELNDMLEADAELAAYPYQFRVLKVEKGVARMSSPRSAKMPAMQGLRVMFPELNNAAVDSERMMAAQEQMAKTQARAAALVQSQQDVERVKWVLDERWLTSNGVILH